MEYTDIFHISACDLIVNEVTMRKGVYVSSYSIHSINTPCNKVAMSRGVKGVIVLLPLNKYFSQYLLRGWSTITPFIHFLIVISLTEVFIEGKEYDDTFHTSAHCDLIAWRIY
jgi:hypothetical protein